MTTDFLRDIIDNKCDAALVVLKGFSPDLITKLSKFFPLIDDYVFRNGKIALEKTNETRLMLSILQLRANDKAICTCESFVKMCNQIRGLGILKKKIVILENNLLELYPNPSDSDIPDFDSEGFQDSDVETALYCNFYSFCIHDGDVQYIQYIDNYSMSNSCVAIKKLAEPKPYNTVGLVDESCGLKLLSSKDGSLSAILNQLYYSMSLTETHYAVEAEEADDEMVRTFVEASSIMGFKVTLSKLSRELAVKPRKELYEVLKQVWGYDSFRMLKIYKDLSINHDVTEISQGSIIETVVRQAEHAFYKEDDKVNHILLTSPTGAGKSLLFQLSAIYLGGKYGLLTIVVSPLVALMNDQVEGLSGYEAVATLNSNKTAADKETILKGVKDGTINILYLSPELLLSYSITTFIGNRKLGLMVIDEAHTVTTWGRDFRVDYWFLGDYLRKARRVLEYSFPIFALTATAVWDPTGKNDMVFDTIRSLNMDPCIKYIGVVRRTNISFDIEQSGINKNYEEKRRDLTIRRIREALQAGRKTIVYFPFRKTVEAIVNSDNAADIRGKITKYHAWLTPEEKKINAEDFRTGKRPIMCATKAFGMGIDVSDISEVYHHAPTGSLSDYVQEIGRLARDPKIQGIAKIDFSQYDFRYIRKLHGLSAIKPYQLMQVLKKLMAIYRINGEKRNMLISASDFSYIFPMSSPDEVDQKLKSCLLLISNDLLNKLRFHALIVRPKSLFSKCYIEIEDKESDHFYRLFHEYLRHITKSVFILDADKLWTTRYNNISFPNFKYKLATGGVFQGFNVALRNQVILCLHNEIKNVRASIVEFFMYSHKLLDEMSRSHHRISFNDAKASLPPSYDKLKREQFLETFRMLYTTNSALGGNVAAYCSIFTSNEGDINSRESFQLMQSGYENVGNLYISAFDNLIKAKEMTVYCDSKDTIVKIAEFLNSLGLADYQRLGGDQPAIFVRINNPYYLNTLIRSRSYENGILANIYEKYRFSERIFTYFFTTHMTDQQRWDFIEAYFLGASEDELLNFI